MHAFRIMPERTRLMAIYSALKERFGHRGWWPGDTKLEIAIGAILTQNTAWSNVERAIERLKAAELMDIWALHQCPLGVLAEAIRPSGYYNQKALKLKGFVGHVVNKYGGEIDAMLNDERDVMELRSELLALKGIGKETADSITLYAAGLPRFVIDAYTKRICSRVFERTELPMEVIKDYDALQQFFESQIERDIDLYKDFHAQIVELGKRFCRKVPLCRNGDEICPLYKGLCAAAMDTSE